MLFGRFGAAASTLLAVAVASPLASSTHAVHEARSGPPQGWVLKEALDRRAVLPMRIGLVQRNLHKGAEWLDDVSHPDSKNYGKHWTAKQVAEAFAPSDETVEAVKNWLMSAGISSHRITQSQGLNWLDFESPVEEAEELFQAKYNVYSHLESEQPHVACEEYSIPSHLKEHIDFVYPTVHFDAKVRPRGPREDAALDKRQERGPGWPGKGNPPKFGPKGPSWHPPGPYNDLSNCANLTTPDCLRALYQFPKGSSDNSNNSYGIVEYTPQAYVPSDLDLFFKNFSSAQIGERPKLDSIDGGVVQTTNRSFEFNGESDLDLEYGMTLVFPQTVTLYQVGDVVEGASFNNFLDAIDASYCTFEGGDDPTQDGTYPDPSNKPGSFKGPENCGGFSATRVISTSYSFNEHDATPFYVERQCMEYMKLGLQGVSILYSSGDFGVAGNGGQCIAGPGPNAPENSGKTGRFNPGFPSTCPFVTAVGATQTKPGADITKDIANGVEPEMACETVIFSGGGFSNVFPLPSYQEAAVKNWFAKFPPPYTSAQFNNSQMVRGFPDIAVNGANFVIALDGNFSLVFGTSASSPTLGSILTLINEERFNAGKGSIGFINPVAYANPGVFNDITEGGNQGCGTPGFSTAPGWDPVTGLGTPNFPKMLKLFMSMP